MQILGINFNNTINTPKTNSVRTSPFVTSQLSFKNNGDVFEKSTLSKFKNFTVDEYKSLSPNEIAKLNEEIDRSTYRKYDNDVNMHDLMCIGMKSYLDNKYGENNYTVIALGRSLSSLAKCLGYKIGEDNVKMVPMSSAGRFCLSNETSENVKSFADYLDSIGLSKEKVEKEGKELVLIDYSYTGRSLIGAKNILQRDDVLGDKKEIHTENIMDMIKGIDTRIIKKYGYDTEQDFRIDSEMTFWNSIFKKYSLVDRCTDLEKTEQAVLDLSKEPEYKRHFLFKLLDREMKPSFL